MPWLRSSSRSIPTTVRLLNISRAIHRTDDAPRFKILESARPVIGARRRKEKNKLHANSWSPATPLFCLSPDCYRLIETSFSVAIPLTPTITLAHLSQGARLLSPVYSNQDKGRYRDGHPRAGQQRLS